MSTPIPTLRRPCYMYPLRNLELSDTIPESADKVGIPTLRRTIPELSRFLHCAEHIHSLQSDAGQSRPLNPLHGMPILNFFSSTANKDMMSKVWTNGDTDIC